MVRVTSPADGGKATRSALAVIAETFGLPRQAVTPVDWSSSGTKLVGIRTGRADEDRPAERLRPLGIAQT
jgi:uncharacterized protein YggU (UPF0235/DUF167 family)